MVKEKSVKPRKLRELAYPKSSQVALETWFVDYARPTKILKSVGISRPTTGRYRKLIKENKKTLQDLVTVSEYQALIELENHDWKYDKEEKPKKADQRKKELRKQAEDLTKQLKSAGFSTEVQPPEENENAKFKRILELSTSDNYDEKSKGITELRQLSKAEQKKYLEFKKEHHD